MVTSRTFGPYEQSQKMVTSFKYLGRVISSANNDWPELVQNLAKARLVWQRLTRVISRVRAAPWVSGFSFKPMVQSVLLFGAET